MGFRPNGYQAKQVLDQLGIRPNGIQSKWVLDPLGLNQMGLDETGLGQMGIGGNGFRPNDNLPWSPLRNFDIDTHKEKWPPLSKHNKIIAISQSVTYDAITAL